MSRAVVCRQVRAGVRTCKRGRGRDGYGETGMDREKETDMKRRGRDGYGEGEGEEEEEEEERERERESSLKQEGRLPVPGGCPQRCLLPRPGRYLISSRSAGPKGWEKVKVAFPPLH